MPSAPPDPMLAESLRRAGHDLPPEALDSLAEAVPLLRAMLARLGAPPAEAEPATTFRAEARR